MTEDLRLRGLSPNTIDACTRAARIFLEFGGRPVDQLDVQVVRRFLLFLIHEKKRSTATVNVYNAAVRFFFKVTLNRTFNSLQIPRQKMPKTLLQVVSRPETASILEHCHNRKHKTLFALTYGSGLRVSEAAAIKTGHIDSRTMRVLSKEAREPRIGIPCFPTPLCNFCGRTGKRIVRPIRKAGCSRAVPLCNGRNNPFSNMCTKFRPTGESGKIGRAHV